MPNNQEGNGLFHFRPHTFPTYPPAYINCLLEQYKLCLLAADNVSARRETTNRYLGTLNIAIIALYGLTASSANLLLLIPLMTSGIVVSIISMKIIKSHEKLNNAKFDVILKIEKHLPVTAFAYEWELLNDPPKRKTYHQLSTLERHIYQVFLILHIVLPITLGVLSHLPPINAYFMMK